jgi:hypothetical protein
MHDLVHDLMRGFMHGLMHDLMRGLMRGFMHDLMCGLMHDLMRASFRNRVREINAVLMFERFPKQENLVYI